MKNEMEIIYDKLSIIHTMYELIRIVDPIKKKAVSYYQGGELSKKDIHCFDFWGNGKVCDNCVSIRAFHENRSFVKIEHNEDKIYMITAFPLNEDNRRVVIELFYNATESMIYSTEGISKHQEIYALLDNMNQIVMKDSLTNIYNRRYINERMPIDLMNATLEKSYYSVIMADIDWFKRVNDNYGHLAGDRVLQEFASLLEGFIRKNGDWIARYGGEEFLIVLPNTNQYDAYNIAERIRKKTENMDLIYNEIKISITSSFGVYTTIPNEHIVMDDIVYKADEQLYIAKNNGRNKVEARSE